MAANLNNGLLTVNGQHDHPKKEKAILKYQLIANLKQEVIRDATQSVGTVYKNSVIKLNHGLDSPTCKSLSSTIIRSKVELIPAVRSNSRSEIEISNKINK